MGKSTLSMAIFNCYVSSPEGTWDSRAGIWTKKNEAYQLATNYKSGTILQVLQYGSKLQVQRSADKVMTFSI